MGPGAQERYKSRYDAAKSVNFDGATVVSEQAKVDAYHMTRMILAQDCRPVLPEGVSKVWAIAAYPAFDAYRDDKKQAASEDPHEALAMVLTSHFLVPESPKKSDDEMLKQAVDLARRDDFRDKRATFHRWQQDIVEQQIPPEKAVEEMEEYLRQYNSIVEKAVSEVYWRYAFMAIPVAISIATAGLGAPLVIAGATGLVSVAAFAKFDRKPKIDAGDCDAAAMIHDVQDQFKRTWIDKRD